MSNKNVLVADGLLGDSGKGRIVHSFSNNFDWVIRHNSSSNSGHVVWENGKKYVNHLLPSAHRGNKIKSFLARDMMINPVELYEETLLAQKDFPDIGKYIYIDKDAFIINSEHVKIDKEQNVHLGTTGKGVGVAVIEKYGRKGNRIYNLINDNAEIIQNLKSLGVIFTTILEMQEEFEKSNLIFEGSQGALLSLSSGLYPFVTTAGEPGASGVYNAGFSFLTLDKVYFCSKPYLSKSGDNQKWTLPCEMPKEEGDHIRKIGGETGNTTGRDRRISYLDLPMLKYGIQTAGLKNKNSLILTKMDILNGQKTVRVCSSYGKELYSPSDFMTGVDPSYIDLPGWTDSRNLNEVKPFLNYVQNYLETPIEYISVGVEDADLIKL